MNNIRFVGLDVHKQSISVAVDDGGRSGSVEYLGEVDNDPGAIGKLCERLRRPGKALSFCYEAGPCGYGILRQIKGLGHRCDVVAPSLIPRKPGDRVKTDRRDATMLARLHRAGELTAVWAPDADHEAMRDLIRLRGVVRQVVTRARQNLQGFLLRHGRKHGRGTAWRMAYRRWLSTLAFEHPAQQIAFQDYVDAVTDGERRLKGVEEQILKLLPAWNLCPVVDALQAIRGIALVTAVVLVAEVGDFTRFANPRQLMAYFGRDDGLGDRRRPGLAGFVAKQAVDSFLGKAPLPAPNRRATDAGAARHFRHRQSVDGEEYDFRALHVLEAVVAIADYPLEAFDVEGAWEDANSLGHTPDSHVRPSL